MTHSTGNLYLSCSKTLSDQGLTPACIDPTWGIQKISIPHCSHPKLFTLAVFGNALEHDHRISSPLPPPFFLFHCALFAFWRQLWNCLLWCAVAFFFLYFLSSHNIAAAITSALWGIIVPDKRVNQWQRVDKHYLQMTEVRTYRITAVYIIKGRLNMLAAQRQAIS